MMKTKRIFLSRALSENSPFIQLSEYGYEIIAKSLIEFKQIDFTEHPKTDWIFFYSKRGVEYYFNQKKLDKSIEYAVMGPGTASAFYRMTGMSPKFTGQGNPKIISETFKQFESGKSILFVKAEDSKDSVQELIGATMSILELVVYENKKKTNLNIQKCDILVFTSPKNFEAYIACHELTDEKVIAIGQTTSTFIERQTDLIVPYCENPSEQNLLSLVKDQLEIKD